jgi:putative transposase
MNRREQLRRRGVACWSYCLMPNHVHLILVSRDADGLALAVGEAHRRYAAFVGARGNWTGHLFQGRFGSSVMDEDHLVAALRYVALNPVKSGLVARAQDWPWSSTRALMAGESDARVEVGPALERVGDFARFLADTAGGVTDEARWERLLSSELVGRPVGEEAWVKGVEAKLGRRLAPEKRWPKPRRELMNSRRRGFSIADAENQQSISCRRNPLPRPAERSRSALRSPVGVEW